MTKLRESTKKQISNTLDRSYFTENSFDIIYNEVDKDFLKISFIPNSNFKFVVTANSVYYGSRDKKWKTSEAPGIHLIEGESFETNDFNSIFKSIMEWTNRILEDYRSIPEKDESDFSEFEAQVKEKIEESNKNKSEPFTSEEAAGLRDTLDTLYSRFEDLSKDNDELKKQLKEIKKNIEGMKVDVQYFPKNTWYRVSGNKIVKMMKSAVTSPEGKKLMVEAAKKYLFGG